jgi:hypothetical protein
MEGREGRRTAFVRVTLHCRNMYLTNLACGSWDTQFGEEWWCKPPIPPKCCMTSRSGSSNSIAKMALQVPNWNPSGEYTNPLHTLCWPFRAPIVSSHNTWSRVVTKCQVERHKLGTGTSQVKRPTLWSLEPLVAKMPKCRNVPHFSLQDFTFRETKMQVMTLLLRTSGHQKTEMPKWFGAFYLEPLVIERLKC